MNEKDQARKQFEMQMLQSQMQQIEEQMGMVAQQILELKSLNKNLDDLSSVEEDKDMVIPLGAGIFIEAKTKGTREVLMNVGSGVMARKSFEDAQKILTKQVSDLEGLAAQLEGNLQKIFASVQPHN
ncbi:prefoldin subunit alpha [archaeon]|jgi:prefoldin alpha subunit|nr:prefoldin subunit alpha [archaeon]MBT6824021.1 prefoldin subunit alpha [archaeon]MBT7107254.1 prefoldin subunit alpha [archaeon]MBT7297175.1 prefoldin subunit alpha [archaeon]